MRSRYEDPPPGGYGEVVGGYADAIHRWLIGSGPALRHPGGGGAMTHEALAQLEAALEELHVAEEELRSQNEALHDSVLRAEAERGRYQELFDAAPDAYFVTDELGVIREANRAAARLLHMLPERLVGKPLAVFAAERHRKVLREQLVRIARGETPHEWEMEVQPRDVSPVPVAVTMEAVGDSSAQGPESKLPARGREVRWLLRDVSQRRVAQERELRFQQEQAARAASEMSARQAMFLAEASSALAAAAGWEATARIIAELAVPTLADFCLVDLVERDGRVRRRAALHVEPGRAGQMERLAEHPPDPAGQGVFARVMRSGQAEVMPTAAWIDWSGLAPEHSALLAGLEASSVLVLPLRARGRTEGTVTLGAVGPGRALAPDLVLADAFADRAALALDNTRLVLEAEEASRQKSEFISVLSHEFRTPLASVVGYADLLAATGAPLTDEHREFVERIKASAWHLGGMLDQILTYSGVEAGRIEPEWQQIELASFVRDACLVLEPAALAKGLALRTRTRSGPLEMRTDPVKLRQILLNLLNNAVKFTAEGEIAVGVRLEGDDVVFEVTDTGPGIAQEHLARVFDPFWQASPDGIRGVGSVGLGLAIARRLISLLGGRIAVRSEVGVGSTFTLHLPRWGGEAGKAA